MTIQISARDIRAKLAGSYQYVVYSTYLRTVLTTTVIMDYREIGRVYRGALVSVKCDQTVFTVLHKELLKEDWHGEGNMHGLIIPNGASFPTLGSW